MKKWPIALGVMLLLCGCYSTYSRAVLTPERVHEGIEADYGGVWEKRKKGVLPPVIYRAGDSWYYAAYAAEFVVRPKRTFLAMGDTDTRLRQRGAVCYHKITPSLAGRLRATKWQYPLLAGDLKRDMRQAGGGWHSSLPKGAVAVEAPLLKSGSYSNNWSLVGRAKTRPKWYRYPMAGVTFIGVDAPINVVTFSVFLVASPVLYMMLMRHHH